MSAIKEKGEKTPLCRHMKQGDRKKCKRYGKYKKKGTSIWCINEKHIGINQRSRMEETNMVFCW